MIETHGLTHIHLFVADLDRSLHFYRDVFGLAAGSSNAASTRAAARTRPRRMCAP